VELAVPKLRSGSDVPDSLLERRDRVVNVHGLIAVGVNNDGHREILGPDVTSAEDGAGWLAFSRSESNSQFSLS
jgi:transposase-like protein